MDQNGRTNIFLWNVRAYTLSTYIPYFYKICLSVCISYLYIHMRLIKRNSCPIHIRSSNNYFFSAFISFYWSEKLTWKLVQVCGKLRTRLLASYGSICKKAEYVNVELVATWITLPYTCSEPLSLVRETHRFSY